MRVHKSPDGIIRPCKAEPGHCEYADYSEQKIKPAGEIPHSRFGNTKTDVAIVNELPAFGYYGRKFNPAEIQKISDNGTSKMLGGIWLSRMITESESNWTKFTESKDFNNSWKNPHYKLQKLKIEPCAKIAVITAENFENFSKKYIRKRSSFLSFEKVSEDFDGLIVTESALEASKKAVTTTDGYYYKSEDTFSGLDVESFIVFNQDIIMN